MQAPTALDLNLIQLRDFSTMANAREKEFYASKAAFAKNCKPCARVSEMQWLHSIPNTVNNDSAQYRGSFNGSKPDKLCSIIPRLYLSSWEVERNASMLVSAHITHILQVSCFMI